MNQQGDARVVSLGYSLHETFFKLRQSSKKSDLCDWSMFASLHNRGKTSMQRICELCGDAPNLSTMGQELAFLQHQSAFTLSSELHLFDALLDAFC